jgi:hypothetical protein
MRNEKGYVVGDNGQLVVTDQQVIVGVMLSQHPVDRTLLHPLLDRCREQLIDAVLIPYFSPAPATEQWLRFGESGRMPQPSSPRQLTSSSGTRFRYGSGRRGARWRAGYDIGSATLIGCAAGPARKGDHRAFPHAGGSGRPDRGCWVRFRLGRASRFDVDPRHSQSATSQLGTTARSTATRLPTLPAALVGAWTRVFTAGEWAHAGGYPAGR